MEIDEWWPRLDSDTREWLVAHNGEALPPGILSSISDAAGTVAPGARWVGEEGPEGFYLSDEAIDWIEATANAESP